MQVDFEEFKAAAWRAHLCGGVTMYIKGSALGGVTPAQKAWLESAEFKQALLAPTPVVAQ